MAVLSDYGAIFEKSSVFGKCNTIVENPEDFWGDGFGCSVLLSAYTLP